MDSEFVEDTNLVEFEGSNEVLLTKTSKGINQYRKLTLNARFGTEINFLTDMGSSPFKRA